jgi:hypothetical protein
MAKKLKRRKAGGELLSDAKETAKIEEYWHLQNHPTSQVQTPG